MRELQVYGNVANIKKVKKCRSFNLDTDRKIALSKLFSLDDKYFRS